MTIPSKKRGASKLGTDPVTGSVNTSRALRAWIPANLNKNSNKIKGVVEFIQEAPSSSSLKHLVENVEQRKKLMACLYEALESVKLGQFTSQLEPGTIEPSGVLTLQVQHSAVATKLHQRLPSILRYLSQHGWDIQTLKIKVLPTSTQPTQNSGKLQQSESKRALSASAKVSLNRLAQNLPEDSATLDAVKKLIQRLDQI